MSRTAIALGVLLAACSVRAEPDVAGLYDVTTEGTTAKLKANEKGKLVILIKAKEGAHISDEAPLKIELSSKEAKLDTQKLVYKDSVAKKAEGKEYPDPKFEIGFTTAAKTTVEAKMTFFVCTASQCARQSKSLTVPIDLL